MIKLTFATTLLTMCALSYHTQCKLTLDPLLTLMLMQLVV